MNFENLKLFRDIAQTHSFSRGATANGISQSAASQHVQELERTLGVELLDRSTRPWWRRRRGGCMSSCAATSRRKEDFEAALQRLKQEVEGTLRVGSIYSVGLSEMVEPGREFTRRQPEAKVRSPISCGRSGFMRRCWAARSTWGSISYPEARLGHHGDSVAARRRWVVGGVALAPPLATLRGGAIAPQDLNGVDFIAFDDDLPIRRHLDKFLKDHGVEVNLTLHFDNIQMIKEAVTHNVGISIMPARTMKEDIEQGRLAAVWIADATLFRPLGIIHRKKKAVSIAWRRRFLDLLREEPGPDGM